MAIEPDRTRAARPPAVGRIEELRLRRCRRCSREAPAYLERCPSCPGALGETFVRRIALLSPPVLGVDLPPLIVPAAALALELSGDPWHGDALAAEAEQVGRELERAAAGAAFGVSPSGVLVAVLAGVSFHDAATRAARAALAALALEPAAIEIRAGLSVGLVDGSRPWGSAVAAHAERLARAAQAGQALAGRGLGRTLAAEWSFAPVGALPRRQGGQVEDATILLGRRRPLRAPSALAPDDGRKLVGRRRELALLDAELHRVRAGEARWCAVVAPAGGGKSKLLRTWLSALDRASIAVAGAGASPFGAAPLALVGEMCLALGVPPADWDSPQQALAALAEALRAAAQARTTVLVVDDLHWADEASLGVLEALAREPLQRCLIVVSLRASHLASVPWLVERARVIRLPGLIRAERQLILSRLLPDESAAELRNALARSAAGANPLYLEQCAALARERGYAERPPLSLHEAILERLELLRGSLARSSGHMSASDIAEVEARIGEWLDRLETGDYEGRATIAESLALLESVDLDLLVVRSLAGLPVERHRRLQAAIERFYSASFAERRDVIERLGERNPVSAGYAAERGARRAIESLRLDDARGYLERACRYARHGKRAELLVLLGDVSLVQGSSTAAWSAYSAALRQPGAGAALKARCRRRLARVALARKRVQAARRLLAQALPALPAEERAVALCDLALAEALGGDPPAGRRTLAQAARAADKPEARRLVRRTRLRLALLLSERDATPLALRCARSLALAGDPLLDLAELVETAALLARAASGHVDAAVASEAERAAQALGCPAAGAKLVGEEDWWSPIHPSA